MSEASKPQSVRQVHDALTAMRDEGDRPGFYEEAADALAALDSLVEQLEVQGEKLVSVEETLVEVEEQLEAYSAALETLVNATMWESENDARSVRQIARKALASNPAKERS